MKLEPKGEIPPPTCKAILLCERTMREAGTAKISLLGLISSHTLAKFPGRTPLMRMFLHLVNGTGIYELVVELHDLAEDRVVFRAKGHRISFPDRLTARIVFFSIPPLLLPHAGRYDVVVFGNGNEIDRQQFSALASQNEGEIK